jgi:hypothetical protein
VFGVEVGVGIEKRHWVKLWEVVAELEELEEVEDSHVVAEVWVRVSGGGVGAVAVGLRTVWPHCRKKPHENNWVLSCCFGWWLFMV